MSAGQRIYRATSYYLPPSQEGNGMTAFLLSQKEAETGSAQLRDATKAMFRRWERTNGFVNGAAEILLPAGWQE